MDGVQVYEARGKMGEKLAQKILSLHPEHDIDCVIPIPETSRTVSISFYFIYSLRYYKYYIHI
jgi:amidophosphoribosyltransferase